MSIEILENTLIKLLVRRGTDNDRTNITLESGELGYTTDTQRLYIGDSTTKGGLVVGNKYQGKAANVTSLAPCVTGDYAFETNTNSFKVLASGNGSNTTDWLEVSNLLSAGDGTIEIDASNLITVGVLSAGNFSPDCLGQSLEINSNRVALSSTVKIDTITQNTVDATSYLSLPSKIKVNAINYDFPGTGPTNDTFLGSDASGNLSWLVPSIIESGVSPTTASVLPVGTIVPFASASNGVPYGWLECDGAEYVSTSYPDLSTTIGTDYNTGGETADHFRVPDLLSKALYGVPDGNPAGSSLMAVTTAAHTQPGLSATGMNFIIKAIGGVTAPTFTIGKNLSAFVNTVDKTDSAFNPLSGSVVIERPAPGQVVYNNSGTHGFTFPDGIHFVKYTVTGTGTKGGASAGGAGATAIGSLSAKPGTQFTIEVGEGFTSADGPVNGNASRIRLSDGTAIITADGGIYEGSVQNRTTSQIPTAVAGGTIDTSNAHVLNGFIVKGGSGMMDTNSPKGSEESIGASSYFGTSPAPGGGQGAHAGVAIGPPPGNGVVILEWS
jgi:microcystin-dependent protein